MSRAGDLCVRFCESLRSFPAAVMCILFFIIQCICMDYYMVHFIDDSYLIWIVADVINTIFLTISIALAYKAIKSDRSGESIDSVSIAWVAWFFSSVSLAAKMIIMFEKGTYKLDEAGANFFGPNTMKTTIALSSIVFLLLLMTQHDTSLPADRKRYIENLTGTVAFDLLDTVDILEVLFDEDTRKDMWPGLEEFVMAVGTFNLVIPTLPLFTLSFTKFGQKKLSMKMLYLHRIALVLMVNAPNLLVRMLLWHGLSVGITPFVLKNVILIALVFYEFYEHKREKYIEHQEELAEEDSRSLKNGGANGGVNGSLDKRSDHSFSMVETGSSRSRKDEISNDVDSGFILSNRIMSFA